MMKNKSNAGKTRKLGNLFSLTGWGVINYNPCDHWMSPLFLQWGKFPSSSKTGTPERARTRPLSIPTETKLLMQAEAHVEQSREQGGEQRVTHTQRNTPWMQLPPGSLSGYLVVNNATPREAGWQILRGSQESTAASEEVWRKPGLEHCVPRGRQ